MHFVHKINPLLMNLFGIKLWYYGLAYTIGFIGVYFWFKWARRRLGWSRKDVYDFSILLALCALFFGRAFEILVYELNYFLDHPSELFNYWHGGMASHGVLLGATVAAWLISRVKKVSFLQIADELVIPAAFFLGLGRIGNFINGQIYGSVTNVWWAVQFPGVEGFRHPVTLYESFKNFMIIPILIFAKRSPKCGRGKLAAHFLFWYGFLRIFTDIFREYSANFLGIGLGQYFNILMTLAGLVLMVWIRKKNVTSRFRQKGVLTQTGMVGMRLPCHTLASRSRTGVSGAALASGWRRLVFLTLLLFSLTIPGSWSRGALKEMRKEKSGNGDYVVLLHGMGRTHHSMKRMEKSLRREGYEVINLSYPSTKQSAENLVKTLDKKIKAQCKDSSKKVNFVTHSLGGILVRCYLKSNKDLNVGRVVMLSPPNSGSEIVDTLKDFRLYGFITGPTAQRLGTGTNDLPKMLGPVDFELGVIAGDRSLNPFYSSLIDGPNDGKVSLKSAKVAGMQDFLVVHSSHTFIMQRKAVIKQVLHFLQHGKFKDGTK